MHLAAEQHCGLELPADLSGIDMDVPPMVAMPIVCVPTSATAIDDKASGQSWIG